MHKKARPDFIIVGAHKAGTTSLFDTICQHPGVHRVSTKEPHYFCADRVLGKFSGVISDSRNYGALFQDKGSLIAGEASVFYSYYYTESVSNILRELDSSVKIIFLVREPVSRAFSAYIDENSKGSHENESFIDALKMEEHRKLSDHISPAVYYKSIGFYSDAVNHYFKNFDHVFVESFENLTNNRVQTLNRVQEFLDLEPIELNLAHSNSSKGTWKNAYIGAILKSLAPTNLRVALKSRFPNTYAKFLNRIQNFFYTRTTQIDPVSEKILTDEYGSTYQELLKVIREKY